MTLKCKSICPKPNLTWHEVDHCPLALFDIPSKVYLREHTVLLRHRVQRYNVGGSYHRDNEDARGQLCRLRFAGARSVIPGEHWYAVRRAFRSSRYAYCVLAAQYVTLPAHHAIDMCISGPRVQTDRRISSQREQTPQGKRPGNRGRKTPGESQASRSAALRMRTLRVISV